MRVHKVEEPTVSRTHTVWFEPDEGEDWGTVRDQVYPNRTFKPNRLCVLVAESGGQVNAYWSQAREHHEGEERPGAWPRQQVRGQGCLS